ncbi:hypothetical protein HCCG_01802 [Helicobacter cinaedi CCUG 18818 = ATCC BAA-847]|uniref:Periplasmic protein n=2 Tax=Helicobacter cinaedi CCUG 18818 = ATCC BAA-847 TaxID=537971 RepID=A0ABN0BEF0_9HELI|nr:hypothetical protein HCCG_01802 [Helicobacter cinaedi CCUG 18818 = ATCC BAA-847]
MMKKYALLYGIIGTLLWLFVLVYLLIGFKDLAKDLHKAAIETHSSLAPFYKAVKQCIDKHNTYPKELLQLGKEESLKVSFILKANTCEIQSLAFDKPKSEFAPHITRVLHKAKACIKAQCQKHNLQEDTQYTIPFFYRVIPDE